MTRERRWQLRKVAAGLCRNCGQPQSPTRRGLCERHRAVHNADRVARQRMERAVKRAMRAHEAVGT